MIHLLGIVTGAWLGFASPLQTAPVVGQAAGSAVGAAATPSAATVLREVQKFYAGTKQLSAKFSQRVINKAFGKPSDSSGNVYLAKPGKMRWDYSDKKRKVAKKSFISNGTYLYVVENDKQQVLKKSLKNDLMPVAVTFLTGKGDLASEFNAEIESSSPFGTKDDVVLKLTPKTPSAQYKSLHLVVAKDNYRVKKSVITDASDNTNEISFFSPDFDKPVKAKWFEFDLRRVKNYRMIDADQPSPPPTK
jgi:outer membrane lipoprotein carrier protein